MFPAWLDWNRQATVAESVTSQNLEETAGPVEADLPLVKMLSTVEELRVFSDERRWAITSILTDEELTVKEIAGRLGEPQKRLYHHIGELERVGLITVTRTEIKFGILQKYYRSTSRFIDVSPSLMNLSSEDEEVQAAIDFYLILLKRAAFDIRQAVTHDPHVIGEDMFWVSTNTIRLTRERARQLQRRLDELHSEFVDNNPRPENDEVYEVRLTLALSPRIAGSPDGVVR
jgi:predicted transcriptional regulator